MVPQGYPVGLFNARSDVARLTPCRTCRVFGPSLGLARRVPYTPIVMFLLPTLLPTDLQAPEYRVVDVVRHATFAGKLGQRVSEDMVVAQGDARILVHIRGTYHTMAVREGSRLHVGDTVTIRGAAPTDGSTVDRERVRKV